MRGVKSSGPGASIAPAPVVGSIYKRRRGSERYVLVLGLNGDTRKATVRPCFASSITPEKGFFERKPRTVHIHYRTLQVEYEKVSEP